MSPSQTHLTLIEPVRVEGVDSLGKNQLTIIGIMTPETKADEKACGERNRTEDVVAHAVQTPYRHELQADAEPKVESTQTLRITEQCITAGSCNRGIYLPSHNIGRIVFAYDP